MSLPTLRARYPDLVVGVLLFLAGWGVGTYYVRASAAAGVKPVFYQSYFEPAVMLACGRGFAVALPEPSPALYEFLNVRTNSITCDQIPTNQVLRTDGIYQWSWVYLMLFVAAGWRLFGISWTALAPMFGLLCAATLVAAWGIFRCGMGRAASALAALALLVSSIQLMNLPHLRDYAKAPFVLALVLLLFCMVRRRLKPAALVGLAVAYGVVLGIGYGFRTDLLANIPPFLVVLFAFLPGGVFRNLGLKFAALVMMIGSFAATSWPVTHYVVQQGGGCQFHVVTLGLATGFNDNLGVTPTFYQVTHGYADELVHSQVNAYWNRNHAPQNLFYCSPGYDTAGAAYFREVVTRFPADMLTRGYASTLRILDVPFTWWDTPLPGAGGWFYRVRLHLLKPLRGTARLCVVLAVLLLGGISIRLGLFAVFFVLYFGGYPALQFASRHYFHLEFIGWWAMGFLAWRGWLAWRGQDADMPRTREAWRAFGARAAVVAVTSALVLALPLPILRSYQRTQVLGLVEHLLAAPRTVVPMEAGADGHSLQVPAGGIPGLDATADSTLAAYLDVHVDLDRCPAGVQLGWAYSPAPAAAFDFSGRPAPPPAGVVAERLLVPVFRQFQRLEFGDAPASCITRVERLTTLQGETLLPLMALSRDWRAQPFYQRLQPVQWWPAILGGER